MAHRLAEVRFGADEVAVGVQEPSEVDARDHVVGLEVERVMVGGARLERRARLDLHGEIAPLVRAQLGQLGSHRLAQLRQAAGTRRTETLGVEVEEQLTRLRVPAPPAVPRDHAVPRRGTR